MGIRVIKLNKKEVVMGYTINSYYLDKPLVKGRGYDVFLPDIKKRDTAIFIVHGGAWRYGSRTGFHSIMEAFCERGYIVASTDYRLYAKDAFEQLKDVREAYASFVSFLVKNGYLPDVAVYGESAGAHLASLLAYCDPGECGETPVFSHSDYIKPKLAILQATPYGFTSSDVLPEKIWDSMVDIAGAAYEDDPERYERLSLRNYIRADNPPTFFLEAEKEDMFPSSKTKEILDRHILLGIPSEWKIYPEMEHGFFYELKRQGQIDAFSDICDFIEKNEK